MIIESNFNQLTNNYMEETTKELIKETEKLYGLFNAICEHNRKDLDRLIEIELELEKRCNQ